jgi:hypothetical protein
MPPPLAAAADADTDADASCSPAAPAILPFSEEDVDVDDDDDDFCISSRLRMMDVTTLVANASGGLYKAFFSSFMRSQTFSADL